MKSLMFTVSFFLILNLLNVTSLAAESILRNLEICHKDLKDISARVKGDSNGNIVNSPFFNQQIQKERECQKLAEAFIIEKHGYYANCVYDQSLMSYKCSPKKIEKASIDPKIKWNTKNKNFSFTQADSLLAVNSEDTPLTYQVAKCTWTLTHQFFEDTAQSDSPRFSVLCSCMYDYYSKNYSYYKFITDEENIARKTMASGKLSKCKELAQKQAEKDEKAGQEKKAQQIAIAKGAEQKRLSELPKQQVKIFSEHIWTTGCLVENLNPNYSKSVLKLVGNHIISTQWNYLQGKCDSDLPDYVIKTVFKVSFGGNNDTYHEIIDRDLTPEGSFIIPLKNEVTEQLNKTANSGFKDWQVGVPKDVSAKSGQINKLRKSIFRIFSKNEIVEAKKFRLLFGQGNSATIQETCGRLTPVPEYCMLIGHPDSKSLERETTFDSAHYLQPVSESLPPEINKLFTN